MFTFEALIWAYSVFWTRCYGLQYGGSWPWLLDRRLLELTCADEQVASLVPLADILNHSSHRKVPERVGLSSRRDHLWQVTYATDQDAQLFAIQVHDPIEAGCEVLSNYGDAKGNERLLLTYGFALPHNAADTYFVQLGRRRGGAPVKAAHEQLMQSEERTDGFYLRRNDVPLELVEGIRQHLLTVEERYFGPERYGNSALRAVCTLYRLCAERLERFPTTCEVGYP